VLLTDLADACRKSGLKVVEVDGWRSRGHGGLSAVETIVCHHTATARSAPGDYPSIDVVRNGRSDLAGPLAQLGLGRSGTVYVIASGVAYHAGEVRDFSMDNWHAIGIEAEADGVSAWPLEQIDAYSRLCAALAKHYRLPVARVLGHKEVCAPVGRKVDPNFDMDAFRRRVASIEEDDMQPEDFDRIEKMIDKALDARVDQIAQATAKAVMESPVIAKLNVSLREAVRGAFNDTRAAKRKG
jgi:hypothetical protein